MRLATAPEDKGQGLVWSVLSTVLLGGFIWWISGSWVIAVAAIIGLFVHEYGHVLAMNRLGMGPAPPATPAPRPIRSSAYAARAPVRRGRA